MRMPPMKLGDTTLSAPAFLIFSTWTSSAQRATMRAVGLLCRADTTRYRLSLSDDSAATRPRAVGNPAWARISSSVASPTR
jgi:hypothetical protein